MPIASTINPMPMSNAVGSSKAYSVQAPKKGPAPGAGQGSKNKGGASKAAPPSAKKVTGAPAPAKSGTKASTKRVNPAPKFTNQ